MKKKHSNKIPLEKGIQITPHILGATLEDSRIQIVYLGCLSDGVQLQYSITKILAPWVASVACQCILHLKLTSMWMYGL